MELPTPRHALKARWLFPVDAPPLANGIVTINDRRIESVGTQRPDCDVVDLGNVALIPGLVNAHAHLEFSELSQPLGRPGMPLSEWISLVLDYRAQPDRPPQPDRIAIGLDEVIRHGTTTIGEIATLDWDFPAANRPPLDVVVFRELICLRSEDVHDVIDVGRQHLQSETDHVSWLPGISPHAPYSVHAEVLDRCVTWSRRRKIPLAIHLAESPEEIQWLETGCGPLADLLAAAGAQLHSGQSRPQNFIDGLRDAHRALIIHGNFLSDTEQKTIAANDDHMTVVYCPRTHAYFGHSRYPLENMLTAGVTVALGTDGRGSSPDLSLLEEMRYVSMAHPPVSPATVLRMATLAGARALGLDHRVGSLAPGKDANLAAIRLPDADTDDPHHLFLQSDLPVQATIYRGQMIWPE